MDQAVFEDVRDLLATLLSVDKSAIIPTAHLEQDLRADSLRLYEVLMELEAKFGLPEITEEEANGIKTVADIVRYIEAKKASA